MKPELLEYHRAEAAELDVEAAVSDAATEARAFHYRAIAWLESLDEGLAISAAAERQVQRENLERLNKQVNG